MKIKTDFVTNSSSTTYIIAIPDSFTITIEDINRMIDKEDIYLDKEDSTEENKEVILKQALEGLKTLKTGNILYRDDFEELYAYSVVLTALTTNDLEITSIETSSDSDYKIIPVTTKTIEKAIKSISRFDNQDILSNIINPKENKKCLKKKVSH